jgi:acetyltransferase-like isoleucine patch superfamily enzyme
MTTFAARCKARLAGVQLGRNVRFLGLPIISTVGRGTINIGDRSVLVSSSAGTALGVRSRVILRCIRPGARITIGADTGLSGTAICSAVSIEIGDRCLIGADCLIFDSDFHNHGAEGRRYSSPNWDKLSAPVAIADDVFVGARVIICKGAQIGRGSIVAAGSVVTKAIPPFSIAAGVPARVVGVVDG